MTKEQLVKECRNLDFQRKAGWRKYFESQRSMFDDRVAMRTNLDGIVNTMRNIRDGDNVQELVQEYTKTLYNTYREYCKDKLTCPITQEDLTDISDATITKCGHVFKKEALSEWLKENDTCPMCRKNIK
jgi:hypothetical protein